MRKLFARSLVAAGLCLSSTLGLHAAPNNNPPAKPGEPVMPTPQAVKEMKANNPKYLLRGSDDSQQLVLTATLDNGREQDLSSEVKYAVADPKIATVSPTGRIIPLANGTTDVVATFGDKTAKINVQVEHMDVNMPINFPNQIVP